MMEVMTNDAILYGSMTILGMLSILVLGVGSMTTSGIPLQRISSEHESDDQQPPQAQPARGPKAA